VKTITIRLSDVEAAMLIDVRKRSKNFKELDALVAQAIRAEYKLFFEAKG